MHKKKNPAYSIGMKPEIKTASNTPGPGAHSLPGKVIESPGKTFSMKLEPKSVQGMLGNGPGSYNPNFAKKLNHSYSIGAKLEDIDAKKRNFQPGPGAYEA